MRTDSFLRNFCIVLVVSIIIVILYRVRTLLTPIFTALVVAYIFYPLISFGGKIGISKAVSIFFVFIIIFSVMFYGVYRVIPTFKNEFDAIRTQSTHGKNSKIVTIYRNITRQLYDYGLLEEMHEEHEILEYTGKMISDQQAVIYSFFTDIAQKAGQFFMIFFFVLIFALLDGHLFYQFVTQLIPNYFFEPGLYMLKKTNDLLGTYLRSLVIENCILSLISFCMFLVLKTFAPISMVLCIVIAVIIGFTNVIRILGPFIGGFLGILLVIIHNADIVSIFCVLFVVVVVQLLDNLLVLPLVMRQQMNIHPVFSLLSVIAGGMIAGMLGMILAIPVMSAVKVIFLILTVEMKKFNMDPED